VTRNQIVLLLFDLSVILVLARAFGAAARRLGQPAVVGEILAGILVGPTLFHGAITHALFPTNLQPLLTALADLGVALFMFLVGLEIDHAVLRGLRSITASVALGSMAVPFGLGVWLAMHLSHGYPAGHRLGFVLFMGTAMSITAFPVLARILEDRGLGHTPLGGLALGSAAVGDVLAWGMLAVVISIASPGGTSPWRTLLVVPFVIAMFLVGRPLLRRLIGTLPPPNPAGTGPDAANPGDSTRALAIVLASLLASAAFLEWTGLNFIFGAFLVGAIVPRGEGNRISTAIRDRMEQLSVLLLMPIFFVIAGLGVNLSTLGLAGLGTLGLILLVAVGGKFAGAFTVARLSGIRTRPSAALATLMNTRGLTELVVLATGLQLGILDHRTYSMMVVMALLTTAMAGPILSRIYPNDDFPRSITNLTGNLPADEMPAVAASK
jgi:Kef-type K+ transport system membrane component KefB